MIMIKKLSQIGGSLGLVIEKPILELYKFEREVEITPLPDGSGLMIRPYKGKSEHASKVEEALKEGNKRYSKMLKNLS